VTLRCPVCESTQCILLGPPARRLPTLVAGVPIDISDLQQKFVRCLTCDYAFIEPCIPEARLLDCYHRSSGHHWSTDDSVASSRFYDRKRAILLKHLNSGKRVLDFGCYDGGFLAYLGEGFDRYGIEPSDSAAQRAGQCGVKIIGPTIEAIRPGSVEPFDGIVSFDVMEHLPQPVPVLRSLRSLLKPGGILMIETGNYNAPRFRKLGPLYYYASIVEHVGFFDQQSIEEAGRRAGLRVVHFEKSVHSGGPNRPWLERFINGVYWTLRGLRKMHVPLPARWSRIASGAAPRRVDLQDHFIAVLQRTAEPV
jgi:SAM-dependent methyltransferase